MALKAVDPLCWWIDLGGLQWLQWQENMGFGLTRLDHVPFRSIPWILSRFRASHDFLVFVSRCQAWRCMMERAGANLKPNTTNTSQNGSVQQEGGNYLFTNSLKSSCLWVCSANIVKTQNKSPNWINAILNFPAAQWVDLLARSMPLLGFGCYKVGVMEPRSGHGHGGHGGPWNRISPIRSQLF
jgi:hypothetical protein